MPSPHAFSIAEYDALRCAGSDPGSSSCLLHVVRRPCKRRGLLRLPRSPGCWARAPIGCRRSMPPQLKVRNWTRQPAASLPSCLGPVQSELQLSCLGSAPGLTREHVLIAHLHRPAPRQCTVTQRALPFQVPKPGACFYVGARATGRRYEVNHGHQAELLVPMLERSVLEAGAPSLLHWPFSMTHWIASVLPAMWPFTRVVRRPPSSRRCRLFSPVGSGGGRSNWLRTPLATTLLRRALLRHCGMSEVRVLAHHKLRRGVVLLRDGAGVGAEPRRFAGLDVLVRALRAALPRMAVQVLSTSANASICEQVAWVYGSGLVLSPHGAHLTNALWLAEGAVLLEAMPWGMWDYRGYRGLLSSAGIAYERLNSARPPPREPHWVDSAHRAEEDERRCARVEACRRFYRANSSLLIRVPELCAALARRLKEADTEACLRSARDG